MPSWMVTDVGVMAEAGYFDEECTAFMAGALAATAKLGAAAKDDRATTQRHMCALDWMIETRFGAGLFSFSPLRRPLPLARGEVRYRLEEASVVRARDCGDVGIPRSCVENTNDHKNCYEAPILIHDGVSLTTFFF